MTATFELKIKSLETYDTDTATNVVSVVNWELIGYKNGKIKKNIGRTEIAEPTDYTSITDFSELTPTQVEQWLISAVGQSDIDARKEGIEYFLDLPEAGATREQPAKKNNPWD